MTLFLFLSYISGPNLRHLAPMTKMEISSQTTYHSVMKVSGVTSKSSQIAKFLVVLVGRLGLMGSHTNSAYKIATTGGKSLLVR
jgi:hypothetical protein